MSPTTPNLAPAAATAALLLLPTLALAQADFEPRDNYGALYEPDSTVLQGVGQNEELALALFADAMPPELFPSLFSTYIPTRADAQRRERTMAKLREMVRYYPEEMVYTVGMAMVNDRVPYTDAILEGVYDDNIDATARSLDSLDRPIIVRIGYESNGFWNGYQPEGYREAFRYVAARMRAVSPRIATAWSIHPIDDVPRLMQFYPGDEFVDWWDISLFEPSFITNVRTSNFLNAAREARKPVLVGESTPTRVAPNRFGGAGSWERWYSKYFEVIAASPAIKAITYINRDWTTTSGLSDWGNTLVNADTLVLRRYREAISSPLYRHLPRGNESLTAIVPAETVVQLSRSDTFTVDPRDTLTFAVGSTDAGDTTAAVLRFDLDTLAREDIHVVKLWLAAQTDVLYEFDLSVESAPADFDAEAVTFEDRPRTGDTLATFEVRNFQRYALYPVDVTDVVRAAAAAGETRVAFTLLGHQDTVLYRFQSPERESAYPPRLQVVYDRTLVDAPSPRAPALALAVTPNPARERLTLQTPAQAFAYELYDVTGRRRRSGARVSGDGAAVDVAGLPPGSYVLSVTDLDTGARATEVVLVE